MQNRGKTLLALAAAGALSLGLVLGSALSASAKPPGGSPPTPAAAKSPPGNPDCANDNGKASPKKANPNGNACGQKNNPPYN
jgi:hypothetical protein